MIARLIHTSFDVRQWDGTPEQAEEIIAWCREDCEYREYPVKIPGPGRGITTIGKRIMVGSQILLPGWWLVDEGTTYRVVGPQEFEQNFEVGENPTNSNLVAHAIQELDRIGETSYEEPSVRKCVLDIIRVFARQGHSGYSAGWTIGVLQRLLNYTPLTALTNDPDEWGEILPEMYDPIDYPTGLWQSKRDPECFSTDGGKTYRRNSEHHKVLHTADEAGK